MIEIYFTDTEQTVMNMLYLGHNICTISDWLGINHAECIKIKRQIFKKLGITRVIQILPAIIKLGLRDFEEQYNID